MTGPCEEPLSQSPRYRFARLPTEVESGEMAKKPVVVYTCRECDAQSPKWLGRCPECGGWSTFEEGHAPGTSHPSAVPSSGASPTPLTEIELLDLPRISSGLPQFDRVLGGGIVPGAVTLIGGEPGVGKSTLIIQVAQSLAREGTVLYVSGEESPSQIALRATRLGIADARILLLSETSAEAVVAEMERSRPVAAIVDSIQTMQSSTSTSAPGSVSQVRDSAMAILTAAKRLDVPVFLIGHITKEGTIAGPKTLEHMVDTVTYFEGDRFQDARILRAFKNRFGPVGEVAMFRMHDNGLEEIANPSHALLEHRSGAPGAAIVAAIEGTRTLMVEIQALVTKTHFPSPRRMAMGVDANRLHILLAVLERRTPFGFTDKDVYVNVTGGLELDEPALDLGIVAAIMSSAADRPLPWQLALFGEVGLLGEVRTVSRAEERAREAAALGFTSLIVPAGNAGSIRADLEARGLARVDQLTALLGLG